MVKQEAIFLEVMVKDFLEYLGYEHSNCLKSITVLGKNFGFIPKIDFVFRLILEKLSSHAESTQDLLIFPLLGFTHYCMYFAMSSLLRCHTSEAFSATRSAIDATLTAYRITNEVETAVAYLNRDKSFQFIRAYVESERKKDPMKYPLAEPLMKAHSFCSRYGSHADISVFFDRLKTTRSISADKVEHELRIHYFQIPEDESTYIMYFLFLMKMYLDMLNIYFWILTNKDIVSSEDAQSIEQSLWKEYDELKEPYRDILLERNI